MQKKIFTFLFACFLMLFALVGCRGKKLPGVINISVETSMTAGQVYQVEFTTENLEENAVLTWTVSDPSVAALDQNDLKIEALKEGTFTLSVQSGDVTASVDVTVAPRPLETYTISYNLDGGKWDAAEGATSFKENSAPELVNPVKDGYTFLGWYENDVLVETLTNKNYTLVAKWEKIKVYFNVCYDLDGGEWEEFPETTFLEDAPFELPTPIKENHNFLGWVDAEGNAVTALENKNYELTATWEEVKEVITHTVTYVLDGGTLDVAPDSVIEGEVLEVGTPVKEGYVFLGWRTYESSPKLLWSITNTNYDLVLYATWGDAPFYVGEQFEYKNLADAIAAANDGDTIIVMPGTYEGAEINKSVTVLAYNWLSNLSTEDFETQSIFTSDLVFAADDITVSGVVITGDARFVSKVGINIANPTVKYSVVRNSTTNKENNSWNAPFFFANSGEFEVTNLQILNCRIEDSSTSRPMIATIQNVNGLTIKGNEFLAHHSNYNDGIKIRKDVDGVLDGVYGVKGEVNISGNTFVGYAQYVIWFHSYGAGNYVVENNTFDTIGSTTGSHGCANFINFAGTEADQVNISMKYNKVTNSMFLFRMDAAAALTDANAKLDINYNSLDNCTGDYYVKIAAGVTANVDNNYWGTINLEEAKFMGATVPTVFYNNPKEIPTKGEIEEITYTIEYDLNGGEWAVMPYSMDSCVADLLNDLGTFLNTTFDLSVDDQQFIDVTYNFQTQGIKVVDFFLSETSEFSEKWKWLRDYMIETRTNDPDQSSGAANLISGDNATWRFEVDAFLKKMQHTSWPYSSNYSTPENHEAFALYAEKAGKGAVVPGPSKYTPGKQIELNAGLYEGKIFQYWLTEEGTRYTNVLPSNAEGDLKLTAYYADEIVASAFDITNAPSRIKLYDTVQLQWLFTPLDTYNQNLTFTSGDETVFTVDKNGLITAVGVGEADLFVSVASNPELDQLLTIKVYIPGQFVVEYETESYVKPTETIKLNAAYVLNGEENADLIWESLNPEIATVDADGVVTGVAEGVATIRATLKADLSSYVDVPVTVIPAEVSEILAQVIASHESNVFTKFDLGIGSGTPDYYYDVYGSVNKILFNDPLTIDDTYLADGNAKYEGLNTAAGKEMTSCEFITVHYTGNMSKTAGAAANAGYFVFPYDENTTSIHFTTGNDGVYQCMDTNKTAAHAGDSSSTNGGEGYKNADGTAWAGVGEFEWLDTGVEFKEGASLQPNVTVSNDLFYEIDGVKTTIQVPQPYSYNGAVAHEYDTEGNVINGTTGAKAPIENYFNNMGFRFIEKDGKYFMAKTWWCYTQVSAGRICSVGGNSNSIGIESCVNKGSDLWWTWQRTAQLVAKLLVDNELDLNRVVGHHFYTAKDCPQPMLENDLEIWNEFMALVAVEYELLTKYADYEIAMEVVSGDALANTGRVTQAHNCQIVTYKVTVTNKTSGETESVTLSSTIAGDYFK